MRSSTPLHEMDNHEEPMMSGALKPRDTKKSSESLGADLKTAIEASIEDWKDHSAADSQLEDALNESRILTEQKPPHDKYLDAALAASKASHENEMQELEDTETALAASDSLRTSQTEQREQEDLAHAPNASSEAWGISELERSEQEELELAKFVSHRMTSEEAMLRYYGLGKGSSSDIASVAGPSRSRGTCDLQDESTDGRSGFSVVSRGRKYPHRTSPARILSSSSAENASGSLKGSLDDISMSKEKTRSRQRDSKFNPEQKPEPLDPDYIRQQRLAALSSPGGHDERNAHQTDSSQSPIYGEAGSTSGNRVDKGKRRAA